ncbi:hypothetical protein AVEN_253845-1 [Araneus ventricosus]|uniref:Transposase Tc1-like domain-containing protein n=1 Tax=Araneus ventricosus TaxID=182803 RepID=A0A4Y2LE82_ARAVE|nr:hypothetical protein AVEN_253845-1 [Araneus ventricosus]
MWSEKLLSSRDRRSLKRLVKKNRKKLKTLELTAMFNTGHKGLSTRTMRRELKGMGLNNCRLTRKTLVSTINNRKRLQFSKQYKDWTAEQGEMSCGLMSQQPIPERWEHQG